MQIYLLRHGIAENGAARATGFRAGTDRRGPGETAPRVEARAAAGVAPDMILSSPYRRAVETAEVAVEVLGFEGKIVRTRALVPEASPVRHVGRDPLAEGRGLAFCWRATSR